MKYLIVNGDDYGHTPGVSAGIRRAHLEGIVTSTTTLMNSPFIENELALLMRNCPRIGIGVHLVLTSGQPVLSPDQLPVLMSLSDDGKSFSRGLEYFIDRLDYEEIRREWQAQIDRFVGLSHRNPDHLDAHHHAMCFSEELFEIYLQMADLYHCAIRHPTDEFINQWLGAGKVPENKADYRARQNRLWEKIAKPDRLVTRFYEDQTSQATLDDMIYDLSEGITEWMCHPGVVDDDLIRKSSYSRHREVELDLLTRSDLRAKLEDASVRLVTFAEVFGRASNINDRRI